jgi:hypothetical protein
VTQALQLLNNSVFATPVVAATSVKTSVKPISNLNSYNNKISNNSLISFDMKSNLHDLFDFDCFEESDASAVGNRSRGDFDKIDIVNMSDQNRSFKFNKSSEASNFNNNSVLMVADGESDTSKRSNSRRLRFDEPSILETSNYKKQVTTETKTVEDDDNLILIDDADDETGEDLSVIKRVPRKVNQLIVLISIV